MLWLAVASEDAQRAAAVSNELWERDLEPQARACSDASGVDQCPACAAALPEGATACGGCGLRFG